MGPTQESHETLLERESAMVGMWDANFADARRRIISKTSYKRRNRDMQGFKGMRGGRKRKVRERGSVEVFKRSTT